MSGRVSTPPPVPGGMKSIGGGGNNAATASHVNGYRIAAVMDRLAFNMQQQNHGMNETAESFNLCLSMARGIDFAIANHEIPSRAQDLPTLLKQVCQRGNDPLFQAALMVLMISVKNACQHGWFSAKDSDDLNNLANQIASNFCTRLDFNTEPSSCNAVIAEIMSRFYPKMKMGHILTFLEAKPGYDAYVKDFLISKHMKHSPGEKIRLFVTQTDSTETSSCLINPQKVNILLNGKGVDRRNSVFMDSGPQMPTNVTHLLKYGSNLLQALGQFNGNYIIVVALMAELSAMEKPTLQDYVQPAADIVDPDSELIVGPSRISLNCPISFKRIKTPVKGQSCNHFQCFDFDNYMDMNSKRPSWRCPHCNQHCCFTEIRIDQNMVKVLKEVGENVNDVIISSDGSWKAIIESDDPAEMQQDQIPRLVQDDLGSVKLSSVPLDVMDLTENDDALVATGTAETEDRKVLQNSSANQSSSQKLSSSPCLNGANEVQQSTLPQAEDNFWSGLYLSTFQSGTRSAISDQIGGITVPEMVPGLTNNARSIPRHVSRNPVAVQALPVQSSTSLSPRLSLNAHLSNIERRLQFVSDPSVLPALQTSSQQQHSNTRVSISKGVTQSLGAYQLNPGHPNEAPSSSLQETTNLRVSHPTNPSAGRFQQSAPPSGMRFQGLAAPQRASQATRAPHISRPAPLSGHGNGNSLGSAVGEQRVSMGSTPPSVADVGVNLTADQDWRPSGRMRGSLSGQAYSAALSQYNIIQPTQQAQAARTPPNVNASAPNSAALVQILMANRAAMQATNCPTTGLAAISSPTGSFPPHPTGLQ